MTKKIITLNEIESAVYGENGLYARTISKIEEIGIKETVRITNKKQQWINIFIRQFKYPEKFDYRPKLDTIQKIAELLGVE